MSTAADPTEKLGEVLRSLGGVEPALQTLIKLYRADRNAFFWLAVVGLPMKSESWQVELATLAANLRALAYLPFHISDIPDSGDCRVFNEAQSLTFGKDQKDIAIQFLRELRGVEEESGAVKSFEGTEVSDAEVLFKIGASEIRREARARCQAFEDRVPTVLKIEEQDLDAIQHGMPGYVLHELANCATRVVQAPTAVFEGTRLGGRLSSATAYCGQPRKAYDNSGRPVPPPRGMVYCVYADPDGYVYDWDWVQEDPNSPGLPVDHGKRFGRQMESRTDTVLALSDLRPSAFRKSKAWHSWRGDCMFFYASDTHAYAVRTNDDLTEYRSFEDGKLVGCKVKNFAEILSKLTTTSSKVPVGAILSASLVRQLEKHQRREKEQFLRLIAQFALEMEDERRTRFLQDVLKIDVEASDYLETIRSLVLRYTTIKQNAVTTFTEEFSEARREMAKRYFKLITAAGNSNIIATKAA